jgi:DNA-binding transcriptional MerR regulator
MSSHKPGVSSRDVRHKADVSARQLQRWSQAGLLREPEADGRNRMWTPDTVDRAWRIKRHLLTVSRSFEGVAFELYLHGYVPTKPEMIRQVLYQPLALFDKTLTGDRRTLSHNPMIERQNTNRYMERHYAPMLTALQPFALHLMNDVYAYRGASTALVPSAPSITDMRQMIKMASDFQLFEACEQGNANVLKYQNELGQLLGSLVSSPERLFTDTHITDHAHTLVESARPLAALMALALSNKPSYALDDQFLRSFATLPRNAGGALFTVEGW